MVVPADLNARPESSLRVADWRFLLLPDAGPEFDTVALDGGDPGLPAMLLQHGVAGCVSGIQSAGDALIRLPGSSLTFEQALALLAPGQVLYFESVRNGNRSRFPNAVLSPSRNRSLARRAGVDIRGEYLILGEHGGATRYLQAEPDIIGWYATNMVSGATLPQRALQRLATRLLPAATLAARLTAQATAIVARKPSTGRLPTARRIQLSSGIDDGSRVVTLWFDPGSTTPTRITKSTRHAEFNDQTEREHEALARLRARLGPDVAAALPKPLDIDRPGSLVSASETWAPGQRIIDLSWRDNRPLGSKVMDLRLAAHWLTAFHRQLTYPEPVDAAAWLRQVFRLPDDIREHWWHAYPDALRTIKLLEAKLPALAGVPMPVTVRHRDFTPWNVLRDGHQVHVIDWENARLDGEPGPGLSELLYFILHWGFATHSLETIQDQTSFIRRLAGQNDPPGPLMYAAREEIQRYTTALSYDRRLIVPLWAAMLVEHAVERERRESLLDESRSGSRSNDFARLLGAMITPIGTVPDR